MKIKNWFYNLSKREQKTITIGAIIAAILLIYTLIYQPLFVETSTLRQNIIDNQALLKWMQAANLSLKKLHTKPIITTKGKSISAITSDLLRQTNLLHYTKGIEQTQTNQVNIKFNNVPFDTLVNFITTLWKQNRINIKNATITASNKTGIVNAQIVLLKT